MITQQTFIRSMMMMLAMMFLMAGGAYAQDDASIMDQLNLSSTQKDQIATLKRDFLKKTEQIRADIKRLLQEEKQIKAQPNPDMGRLRSLLKDRADKEIELSLELTGFNEKLEGILTSAQRATLAKLKEERRKER